MEKIKSKLYDISEEINNLLLERKYIVENLISLSISLENSYINDLINIEKISDLNNKFHKIALKLNYLISERERLKKALNLENIFCKRSVNYGN
ncbi:MAG: hypothetical protein KatS3mg068_2503 [Candidatus Sericytochromatia bacterium]|nr:MAG: hypothetical protein KatS3mg068_1899 [Candidatus Sericytochromatia bacterium]GIW23496.1 MAG: hypothetical protein KatS3mg068_2503 [Candidatus Sericytochromatia bacterium]